MRKLLSTYCRVWLLSMLLGLVTFTAGITPASATSLFEVPNLPSDTRVVDLSEVISRISEGSLNGALQDLADRTEQSVHYVTIRRLDYDETIESFTEKLFQQWFPTPETGKNQTLLVMDTQTNNTAIVAGESAKTKLSDPIARSIAQETVQVPLREGGRYNQAFLDATDRLAAVLSGAADPGPPVIKDTVKVEGTFASPEETQNSNAIPWVIGLLIAATVIPMVTYYFYVR